MADAPQPSLLPTLRDLGNWFRQTNTPYLVIGGVAVSLVGRARMTQDVDLVAMIDEASLEAFMKSGANFGFVPRVSDPIGFARTSRMLLMAHESDRIKLDIALAGIPFEEEAIGHAVGFTAHGLDLCLPRVEDLIVMKAVAARPVDLGDIDNLLEMNPKADREQIRKRVREFSQLMDAPEIAEQVEKLLTTKRA